MKQLNKLFSKARKNNQIPSENSEFSSTEKDSFQKLLIKWESTSKELLDELAKKDSILFRNRNPKSLMALGALESYLTLALQAEGLSKLD